MARFYHFQLASVVSKQNFKIYLHCPANTINYARYHFYQFLIFDSLYKVTENVTVSVSYILRSGLRHKGFRIFLIAQPEREPNVLFDH